MILLWISVLFVPAWLALRKAPSFLGGLCVGGWYVYSLALPPGFGYPSLIAMLVVLAVFSWLKEIPAPGRFRMYVHYGFGFMVPIVMMFRELLDPDVHYRTWTNVVGFVAIGLAVISLCSTYKAAVSFVKGFIVASSVFSVGEVLRVVQGGPIHYQWVAFGANPIFAGHFLVCALFLTALLWSQKKLGAPVACLLIGLQGGGVILLASFGVMAALVAGTMYLVLSRASHMSSGRLFLFASMFLALPGFVALALGIRESGSDLFGSGSERSYLWSIAWLDIQEKPLLGVGTDVIFRGSITENPSPTYYPHNVFLEAWSVYGAFALLALAVMLVVCFRVNHPWGRAFVLIAIVAFSLSGTMSASFNFWVILVLAYVSSAIVDGREAEGQVPLDGSKSPFVDRRSNISTRRSVGV